jgi:hypothetical protein
MLINSVSKISAGAVSLRKEWDELVTTAHLQFDAINYKIVLTTS